MMQHVARGFGVLLVAFFAAGCDVAEITFGGTDASYGTSQRWSPWITTDHQTYVLEYTQNTVGFDIVLRFHNRGRVAAAIPRCGGAHRPVLEKLVWGEWVEVLSPQEECWDVPAVVGPGRSASYVYRVRAGRPHTTLEPQFRTNNIPGTYRLRWDIYEYDMLSQFHIGPLLPIESRVSNEFRVIH
jgi:hypothetical protein